MRPLALGLTAILASCAAAPPEPTWHWEGGNAQALYADDGQCKAQAWAAANLIQVAMIYDGCMRGKGWHRVADR